MISTYFISINALSWCLRQGRISWMSVSSLSNSMCHRHTLFFLRKTFHHFLSVSVTLDCLYCLRVLIGTSPLRTCTQAFIFPCHSPSSYDGCRVKRLRRAIIFSPLAATYCSFLTAFLRMGELALLSEGRLRLCFPGARCTLQPPSNTFKGFAGGP